jgi:hypothetical protein
MKMFPKLSTHTEVGALSFALVARPPSPANPGLPVPATVLKIPVAEIFRIRWPNFSAMNTFPLVSTNRWQGDFIILLDTMEDPSPANPEVPFPRIVTNLLALTITFLTT